MTLCALTFSNTSFVEEALKYLLRIAAKLTHSTRRERVGSKRHISTNRPFSVIRGKNKSKWDNQVN